MPGEQVVLLQPNMFFCFGDPEALFSLKAEHLLYAYTCDLFKHYSYLQIKIKINDTCSPPMPSFAELGVEGIASFCFCNFVSLHGSKSNV